MTTKLFNEMNKLYTYWISDSWTFPQPFAVFISDRIRQKENKTIRTYNVCSDIYNIINLWYFRMQKTQPYFNQSEYSAE